MTGQVQHRDWAHRRDPAPARVAGLIVLAVAAGRASATALRPEGGISARGDSGVPRLGATVRVLHAAAMALAGSVLADSAVEHYRGSFENPGMVAPLLTSALVMLGGASGMAQPRPRAWRRHAYRTALGVGAAGTGFHLFNLLRRPGRLSWQNLFYGAPLGAPVALSLSGLVGEAAESIALTPEDDEPRLAGLPAGRALAGLAALGIAGTSAEAALLHFRGAFHNPLMVLPVSLPPVAAALLARATLGRAGVAALGFTRWALAATAVLGPAGVALHAYGVSRAMGGWRNWSQTVVDGPPLPAPPAFSALAVVGLAALGLIERDAEAMP